MDRVVEHYKNGVELERLASTPLGILEYERTISLLTRWGANVGNVLDVGGGPGIYAEWLSNSASVELIDIVPLHVEAAKSKGIRAKVGDARKLPTQDLSADVVLLMGPLYHLESAEDRLTALRECHRVLRPGGQLIVATISRYAWMFDAYRRGLLNDEAIRRSVQSAIDGEWNNKGFPGYFHSPGDLASELITAGFTDAEIVAVEGPAVTMTDLESRLEDAKDQLLTMLSFMESEPQALAVSSHLLTRCRRPQN